MSEKKTILILVEYYLPAFKAGGAIRSIEGFVHTFGENYNIKIVTNDRDIGDKDPFNNVKLDCWNRIGNASVFYLKRNLLDTYRIFQILRKNNYDLLYVNSYFSRKMSILPILLRAFWLIPSKPLILAPRGEFSPGALEIKPNRKFFYIGFVKFFNLIDKVYFQASTQYEKLDILKVFSKLDSKYIIIAGDLSKSTSVNFNSDILEASEVDNSKLLLVFLSRISQKKNLYYALEILSNLNFSVQFDIYGPIEDESYWGLCQKLIDAMADQIKVKYCGILPHEKVISTLKKYDLFFLPTMGENYGHVIEEAIHAGLPILVSDQTPWRNLKKIGVGSDIPLIESQEFIRFLNEFHQLSFTDKKKLKQKVLNFSTKIINKTDIINANRLMIEVVLGGEKRMN